MKLLALVPSLYNTSPGQRFRIEQWEPLLREQGVEIDFEAFESEELHSLLYTRKSITRKVGLISKAFMRRAKTLRSVHQYDAVYLLREAALLGPPVFERWLHRQGISFIFDFDDAIFVPYVSPSNGYLSYLKFPAKTGTICKLAAHVMVGNSYLADYARQTTDKVTIIPTTIDTQKYRIEPREENRIPVIGWSGSYSTVQHLDTLARVLARLAEREKFRLRVIGTNNYQIEGVDVEVMNWNAKTEIDDLRPIDIGIMPLPDDPWSRGKCGLKALQYMALGIPSVCSSVGVNAEIISDGENGYLAATEDEWVEKLTLLLKSIALRKQLGWQGRATVEANYSAAAQAPRVYRIFESVVHQKKKENQNGK